MSICVVDFISNAIVPNILPNYQHNYIICAENCQILDPVVNNYVQSSNIETLLSLGSYIIRISNDIQRGFLLGFLCNKFKADVYSHRPEVISRTLNIQSVRLLPTPDRVLEAGPSFLQPSQPSVPSVPKKPLDNFDMIYQESLEKYIETILTQQIRAVKFKSAKAQLKNIVDGIIIKNQKKNNMQVTFSSDEIVESMFSDLETHGIISASVASVTYFDDWIECYFGKRKGKEFLPRHRNPNEIRAPQRPNNQVDLSLPQELLQNLLPLFVQNPRLNQIKSVGELSHLIKTTLNTSVIPAQIQKSNLESISEKILYFMLKNHFDTEDGQSPELVIQNIAINFGTKITKRQFLV